MKDARVVLELALADITFARDQLNRAALSAADAMEAFSIEMRLLCKDDPFDDDDNPLPESMADFAACDEATERLNDIRLLGDYR